MMEIWKDVVGYEGSYQVSNLGNVKSVGRFVNSKGGSKRAIPETLLRPQNNKRGYLHVTLKRKTEVIHRLVAKAFLTRVEGKNQVNHIDGNKKNNNITNLEWCNASENMKHAYKLDLVTITYTNSKLSREDVVYIKDSNISAKELAKEFKVSSRTIHRVKKGTVYKHYN